MESTLIIESARCIHGPVSGRTGSAASNPRPSGRAVRASPEVPVTTRHRMSRCSDRPSSASDASRAPSRSDNESPGYPVRCGVYPWHHEFLVTRNKGCSIIPRQIVSECVPFEPYLCPFNAVSLIQRRHARESVQPKWSSLRLGFIISIRLDYLKK
jgi:hypothetical protein